MYYPKKHKTKYHLRSRDGSYYEYDSYEEMIRFWPLGYWIDQPYWQSKFPPKVGNSFNDICRHELGTGKVQYIIRTDTDEIVDWRQVAKDVEHYRKNKTWFSHWYVYGFRNGPVYRSYGKPFHHNTNPRKAYGSFRYFKTTQERRFWFEHLELQKEYKFKLRRKRSFMNLPNAWDDFYSHNEKCWKRHRKTQYKQKMM